MKELFGHILQALLICLSAVSNLCMYKSTVRMSLRHAVKLPLSLHLTILVVWFQSSKTISVANNRQRDFSNDTDQSLPIDWHRTSRYVGQISGQKSAKNILQTWKKASRTFQRLVWNYYDTNFSDDPGRKKVHPLQRSQISRKSDELFEDLHISYVLW